MAAALRAGGRAALVVAAADFLRPASVRLEYGREDPDEFLDGWLDESGLRREVLDPAGPAGTGRVLPRLWDAVADRAYRDGYTELPDERGHGAGRRAAAGPRAALELAVHLRMSGAALARNLPEADHWTLAAYARYDLDERRTAVRPSERAVNQDQAGGPAGAGRTITRNGSGGCERAWAPPPQDTPRTR